MFVQRSGVLGEWKLDQHPAYGQILRRDFSVFDFRQHGRHENAQIQLGLIIFPQFHTFLRARLALGPVRLQAQQIAVRVEQLLTDGQSVALFVILLGPLPREYVVGQQIDHLLELSNGLIFF